MKKDKNVFVFFFWFVSWKAISLGLHLNLNPIHFEIHLPFGFIKIGLNRPRGNPSNWNEIKWRKIGWD